MRILGISAFYHDSAAALIEDGRIVCAAQEERFSRKRHDSAFPAHAIRFILEQEGIRAGDIDFVAFYDKPFLKFERLLDTYLSFAPRGFSSFRMAIPLWLREKLFQKDLLGNALKEFAPDVDWSSRLLFSEHHYSHACSAFFPSPFEEAALLIVDGVGEWATTSAGMGHGTSITLDRELRFPHSLGLLYAAFTTYLGFKINSGEYKMMGLAPYGVPRHTQQILDNLIDVKPDGTFRLDMSYFNYCVGLTMTTSKFHTLFGGPPRAAESELLTQHHMDLAASIQAVTEVVMLRLATSVAKESGSKNLCLAGGVALNCVANGVIQRAGIFSEIWIQPGAGDAGGAIGAALAAYHGHCGAPRTLVPGDAMQGSYLGPQFSQSDIESRLTEQGAKFEVLSDEELVRKTAEALQQEAVVGWFQGRMEFGPRSLGARSILADPRSPAMQKTLNLKIKYRESFRPFAPAVLREHVSEWFEFDGESPYMLMVAPVRPEHRRAMTKAEEALFGIDKLNVPRSSVPAITHVDYSARLQTVSRDTNSRFHSLISAFRDGTGCPILINTSFNVRGEPIVCTPQEAFRCFMGTGIDVLAIGNCFLRKQHQDSALLSDYAKNLEPD